MCHIRLAAGSSLPRALLVAGGMRPPGVLLLGLGFEFLVLGFGFQFLVLGLGHVGLVLEFWGLMLWVLLRERAKAHIQVTACIFGKAT